MSTGLIHEIWVDQDDLPVCCLAGPDGDGARALSPGARLVHVFVANSHVDAMREYHAFLGREPSTTAHAWDLERYPEVWHERQQAAAGEWRALHERLLQTPHGSRGAVQRDVGATTAVGGARGPRSNALDRRKIDSAKRDGTGPAPSSWAIVCQWFNLVLALVAVLLFAITVQAHGDRAPGAFFLGAPLFLLQGLFGLVPAIRCVRRERLVGSARWWLLAPAIAGAVFSVTAVIVSLATYGGC